MAQNPINYSIKYHSSSLKKIIPELTNVCSKIKKKRIKKLTQDEALDGVESSSHNKEQSAVSCDIIRSSPLVQGAEGRRKEMRELQREWKF